MTFDDIEAAFNSMAQELNKSSRNNEKNDNCYPYPSAEMCWNHGTFVGKLIPDSNGCPFRKIDNAYLGRIPFPKDEGEGTYNRVVNIIGSSSYRCELTPEQKELNDNLISEVERNIQLSESLSIKPNYKQVKRVSIFYMMVRRFINVDKNIEEYETPNITVMIHRSFNFLKSFTDSVSDRTTNLADNSWMREYFNRDVGANSKLVSIKTTRPAVGYEVNIDYLDLPKLSFEVSEENINRANDLNSEIININSFDEEFFKDCYEKLKAYNDSLESNELSGLRDVN